jgi:hypothetical protein
MPVCPSNVPVQCVHVQTLMGRLHAAESIQLVQVTDGHPTHTAVGANWAPRALFGAEQAGARVG